MTKIQMKTPLVEMDGDEMTRIIWQLIKDELLAPHIDLKTEYFDLGLANRDATDDQVTVDAAHATKRLGVGVKCATITPNAARVQEYGLKEMWKSPNGTIRAMLDGTVFRTPILVKGIQPVVRNWDKPITIARHAYGDIYKNVEIVVPGAGKVELVYTGADGAEIRELVHEFAGPGVAQGVHNLDSSITSFAHSCFRYALDTNQDLWFSTKDTISKKYDHRFKDIFAEVYEAEYADAFAQAGIQYFYTLITSTRPLTAPCNAITTSTWTVSPRRRTPSPPSSPGRAPCASAASLTGFASSWLSPTVWSGRRSTRSSLGR